MEVDEPSCISMRCEISHSMRLPGLRHGSVRVRASPMKCAHEFVSCVALTAREQCSVFPTRLFHTSED